LRLLPLEDRRTPAVITVTTTADENDGIAVGGVSLRDAIAEANANADPTDVIDFAPSVTGTINLATNGFGAIKIAASMTIVGPGQGNLAIDGGDVTRLVTVDNGAAGAVTVEISGLTLRQGFATGAAPADRGGAIFMADEKLTLVDCSFTLNRAAGSGGAINVGANGTLIANGCSFTGNTAGNPLPAPGVSRSGGAIYGDYLGAGIPTNVTISASNCLFDSNTSTRRGGAIRVFAASTLTLDNCTLSNNVANTAAAEGGAVHAQAASVTITNCTISSNSAGASPQTGTPTGNGGGLMFDGAAGPGGLTIRNSTISGNATDIAGGGIALGSTFTGTLVIQNSSIVGNSAFGGAASVGGGGIARLPGSTGSIALESTVIAGNNSANTNFTDLSNTGMVLAKTSLISGLAASGTFGIGTLVDLGGNLALGLDAQVGGLQNNGGTLLTHLPNPGSPVRGAGSNPAGLTTDQRGPGFPRQLGDAVDIGAVESNDLTGTPWAVVGLPANPAPGAPTVSVTVTYRDDVGINPGTIDVNDLTLTGPGSIGTLTPTKVTASGPNTARVAVYEFAAPGGSINAPDNGLYTINLKSGEVTDGGGAPVAAATGYFNVQAPFVVDAANDEATDTDGKTSLREALLAANAAAGADTIIFDPAVFAGATTITLTNGFIPITGPTTLLGTGKDALTVSGNLASRHFVVDNGAATSVTVNISDLTLRDGKMTDTTATGRGGSILLGSESLTLTNVRLTNNEVVASGGGAIASNISGGSEPVRLTLINCEATNNRGVGSVSAGGVIWVTTNVNNTVVLVQNSVMTGNSVTRNGGVLYSANNVVTFENCTLSGNEAKGNGATTNGGGAFYFAGSAAKLTLTNCTISGNKANFGSNTSGGALSVAATFAGTVTIRNSTIAFNQGNARGGGLNFNTTKNFTLTVDNSIIAKNSVGGVGIGPDIFQQAPASGTPTVAFTYSLLGDTAGILFTPGTGAKTGVDPQLTALGNFGGPMPTHLVKANSPARDAGDPAFTGLATDQRGLPRVVNGVIDMGATELAPVAPTAAGTFPNVTTAGGTTQSVTVTFADDLAVSVASLDGNDIRIKGPGGFDVLASFVGVDVATDGTPRVATYAFTPPGGSWDAADTGTYDVFVEADQALDVTDFAVAAGKLGSFQVNVTGGGTPPTVTGVQVNTGAAQRSVVTSLKVSFSEAVTFPSGLSAAFQLVRTGPGGATGAVNLTAVPSGADVTLTFLAGGAVPTEKGGSLIDGVYQLTVVAANVLGAGGLLDGDGNGSPGGDFVTPGSGAGRLFRLFGDADGDGDVDAQDFGAFRAAFGGSNPTFDSDGDGDVDATDFGAFRGRFGSSI